jgi:uncharacterized protein (DUF305 family)
MKIATLLFITLLAFFNRCERPPVQHDVNLGPATASNSGVRHEEMMSSPGAADAPYELQFLDTMIAHHEGAIDMSQLVATRAQHAELKQLAKSIIADQQKEIAQMKEWRRMWFGDHAPAINMEMPGMGESMSEMNLDKLDELKENAFDLEFLRQMVAHHEGAIRMANHLLTHDTKAELRTVAGNIVNAQEAEIKQMREWEKDWSKK